MNEDRNRKGAGSKARRQRDNWKRRAEEAEARLLEVEVAMENILPKIKVARWKAMHLNAEKAGKGEK